MVRYFSFLFGGLALFFASNTYAWNPAGAMVTITEIVEWQGNGIIGFKLSSGYYCYIPPEEKNVYALVLSLFSTNANASVHCHDAEENQGGIMMHRLHRIIALK